MAKVVTPITARVEVIGRPKESQHGPGVYYPTLFIDESKPQGTNESKVWKNLSGDEVSQLMKGDRVQLIPAGQDRSGKAKHNIVLLQSASDATPQPDQSNRQTAQTPQLPPSQSGMSPELKRQIAAYIDEQSDLLRFCWLTAKSKLQGIASDEESYRAAAATLFIASQKKFGL